MTLCAVPVEIASLKSQGIVIKTVVSGWHHCAAIDCAVSPVLGVDAGQPTAGCGRGAATTKGSWVLECAECSSRRDDAGQDLLQRYQPAVVTGALKSLTVVRLAAGVQPSLLPHLSQRQATFTPLR